MPKKPLVFVVMSFDDEYFNFYMYIQAIAGVRGVEAVRADESRNVIRKIRSGIFSKIRDADLVIAEISSGSPNVLYEVGWAHAMGKSTLLFAKKDAEIPFDINDYLVLRYDPNLKPELLRKYLAMEFDKYLDTALKSVNLKQPLVEMLGSVDEVAPRDDLFTHLLGWSIERFAQEARKWTSDTIHVGAAEAIEKGMRIFQLLQHGGFATYLVPLNPFWTTETQYLQSCREASRVRGAKIQRVFILPNHEALFSTSLHEHVKQDENSGILTHITFEDSIPEGDAVQDFGLWDEELLCLIEVRSSGGESEVKGCLFTREASSIQKARLWKDNITSVSQPAPTMLEGIDNLDEKTKLLVRSVDGMRKHSKEFCIGSYLTKGESSCEWYHSAWQYLRILGLVSTPDWHTDFYGHAFKDAFNLDVRDILVSGTADYAILDHLAGSIPKHLLQTVIITVLDACSTPLHVCRWYNRQYEEKFGIHLNLRYNQRDALETNVKDESFDVITSDAFITRFEENDQTRLVKEWYRLLKPNGRIITTARLSHGLCVRKTMASQDEIEDFITRAKQHIETKKPWLRPMKDTILELANSYAHNIVSYTLPSEDYIRKLFHQFSNLSIECGNTDAEFEGKTEYARIIVEK